MVLARSMFGTTGVHAPIISIHDTWCAKARGARDTNRGGPNVLSIRPTDFVTDEIRTHNLRIMDLVFYQLTYSMYCYIFMLIKFLLIDWLNQV